MGYVHFAFLGEESVWAAEATECAAEQDAFWEFHDKLFEVQGAENSGGFSKDNLKSLAEGLGLDTAAFNACLDSGNMTSVVKDETEWSKSLGLQSTPVFIVNGKPVVGSQPFDVYKKLIEEELGQ